MTSVSENSDCDNKNKVIGTLADFRAQLREAEEDLEEKSSQMGRLKAEYSMNINSLRLAYYPKMQPYTTAIYQAKIAIEELLMTIRYLEAKVNRMEQMRSSFYEPRDMAAVRKAILDNDEFGIKKQFEEIFTEMEGVTKDELAIMRSYDSPQQCVLDTIIALMILRNEPEPTWEQSKVLFSETYYYTFFTSKARNRHKYIGDFTDLHVETMKKYVYTPEYEASKVGLVSRPCGIFSKWISTLYRYYLINSITKNLPPSASSSPPYSNALTSSSSAITGNSTAYSGPSSKNIEFVRGELMTSLKELGKRKAEIAEAEDKLSEIEADLNIRLEDLRKCYDDTMEPLQELFFEANTRFNSVFTSPRRERERKRLEELAEEMDISN